MKKIETIQLSYQDSMVLRGIAILMMIFLHCFNYQPQDTYIDIVIGGNTLSWWLTRTASLCVPLYCILSGYGLYKKYPYDYGYCWSKARILIKRYWIFLFIFWGIGVLWFDAYKIELSTLLSNFLGYDTTYNPTLWFLLPYLCIMLFSPLLIKWFNQTNLWKCATLVILAYGFAFFCLKMYSMGAWSIPAGVRVILSAIQLLFSFMCGAIMAKYGIPKLNLSNNWAVKGNVIFFFLLLLFVLLRALITNTIASPPLCVILIVLLANINYSKGLKSILEKLGKHSLNMWFIHAYFTYGYLKFCIYWSDFPLLIFISLVLISYCLSKISEIAFNQFNI